MGPKCTCVPGADHPKARGRCTAVDRPGSVLGRRTQRRFFLSFRGHLRFEVAELSGVRERAEQAEKMPGAEIS